MEAHPAYDIIGDIHGCSDTLMALLDQLDYAPRNGVHQHPSRQAIFLGDFIDRGPQQREVIAIVRPMIASGIALSVMGNHEFNAIAFATHDAETGDYLRAHSDKNTAQHHTFLDAYAGDAGGYADTIDWFKTLPLWLDLGCLRVVHACWDDRFITRLKLALSPDGLLSPTLLKQSTRSGSWQFEAVETLLKGKEIPLQAGVSFRDEDGHMRHHIRVRWWDQDATTYRAAFMGPAQVRTHIPDDEVAGNHLVEYSPTSPPVFLGHYWLEGRPAPLASNIACVDYSVAKPGGKLVAYR